MHNNFFKTKGPFPLSQIIDECENLTTDKINLDKNIENISILNNANSKSITFLNSSKYKDLSIITEATSCITTENLSKYVAKSCCKIIVKNVLFAIAQVSKKFYPEADLDRVDLSLEDSKNLTKKYPNVKFGKNVLIGSDVKIGENSSIGNNTIIEHDVVLGENCLIGSNVIIKNTIAENNIYISDGSNIGQKGFGFIPNKNKNFRFPHIGIVHLKRGAEIGSSCTIDRGSISNTVIGENTFLDNQVHVAHNVNIGKNCMIAGQVGIAGSATLGENVVIGGQAGISGHLTIGNNVQIGGGSGVIKNVPDNSKIMGYPSTNFKNFIKKIEA